MKSRRNNPERDGEFGPAEMQEGLSRLKSDFCDLLHGGPAAEGSQFFAARNVA
jgi:hypothetical protein